MVGIKQFKDNLKHGIKHGIKHECEHEVWITNE